MRHSIIIPHRERHDHLWTCLRSISHSAAITGETDYEVIVVDSSVRPVLGLGSFDRVREVVAEPRGAFNKSRSLNLGINQSYGDIVSILDADAIVGEQWMAAALAADGYTRVCYRVRRIPFNRAIIADQPWEAFASWVNYPIAYEAYGTPMNTYAGAGEPWGNSQFSIRREHLGSCRFDESFSHHGREDLDLNMQVAAMHGDAFRGHIWTDPAHAMVHRTHRYEADWKPTAAAQRAAVQFNAKWFADNGATR
jgi:glycosyltransferase involved in cell wall biosynthesis